MARIEIKLAITAFFLFILSIKITPLYLSNLIHILSFNKKSLSEFVNPRPSFPYPHNTGSQCKLSSVLPAQFTAMDSILFPGCFFQLYEQ